MSGLAETHLSSCRRSIRIVHRTFNLDCWSHVENFDQMLDQLPRLIQQRLNVLSGVESVKMELLDLFCDEADDFFDRLQELLCLFGLEPVPSHDGLLDGWRVLHAAGVLIQNIKYTVNIAFNRHFLIKRMPKSIMFNLGLDLFPQSMKNCLGRIRSDEKRWKRKSLYLINTLFQGWKKGLLPLSPDSFIQTMRDHKESLCKTDGSLPFEIKFRLREILEDLFSNFNFEMSEKISQIPSSSATIESKRKNNGAMGTIVALQHDYSHFSRHDILTPSYKKLAAYEEYVAEEEFGWNKVFEGCFPFLAGYIRSKSSPVVKPVYFVGPTVADVKGWEYFYLRKEIDRTRFDMFQKYTCAVSPYGVLEPLKIRVITRPNWKTHLGLRSAQKQLLNYLRVMPEFSIIGDSNRDHLLDHIRPLLNVNGWIDTQEPSPFWNDGVDPNYRFLRAFLSGDFKAASDKIKRELTELVWEVCSRTMPPWMRQRALISLTRSKIIYNDDVFPKTQPGDLFHEMELPDPEVLDQINGQLMGHILSFPILCAANYSLWHLSMEKRFSCQLRMKQMRTVAKVKVNGDDLLCRSDPEHFRIWRDLTGSCGLEESLGKCFYSDDFCQINSQLFKVKYDMSKNDYLPNDFVLINYFNFGQLTGRKKGLNSDDSRLNLNGPFFSNDFSKYPIALSELSSVRKNFLEMFDTAPTVGLQKKVLELQKRWFNRRFKSLLTPQMYSTLSLPFHLGGLHFDGEIPNKVFNLEDNLRGFFKKSTDGFDDARQYYSDISAISRFSNDDFCEFQIGRPKVQIRFNPGPSGFFLIPEKIEEVKWVKDSVGGGSVPIPC